ncbi:MAG: hypothetical protein ACK4VO_01400 [Pseudobdellovibrio sp.]
MKHILMATVFLASGSVFAAAIGKEKLDSISRSREAISARIAEMVTEGKATEAARKSILEAIKENKDADGKFAVSKKTLSESEKVVVRDILNSAATNAGVRLTGGSLILDAVAKRPEILNEIIMMISNGKESKEDLELFAKGLQNLSSDAVSQQKEILAISKIISLSKSASGNLKSNMEKAKNALREGKSVVEALKAAGIKEGKGLEDFIIC